MIVFTQFQPGLFVITTKTNNKSCMLLLRSEVIPSQHIDSFSEIWAELKGHLIVFIKGQDVNDWDLFKYKVDNLLSDCNNTCLLWYERNQLIRFVPPLLFFDLSALRLSDITIDSVSIPNLASKIILKISPFQFNFPGIDFNNHSLGGFICVNDNLTQLSLLSYFSNTGALENSNKIILGFGNQVSPQLNVQTSILAHIDQLKKQFVQLDSSTIETQISIAYYQIDKFQNQLAREQINLKELYSHFLHTDLIQFDGNLKLFHVYKVAHIYCKLFADLKMWWLKLAVSIFKFTDSSIELGSFNESIYSQYNWGFNSDISQLCNQKFEFTTSTYTGYCGFYFAQIRPNFTDDFIPLNEYVDPKQASLGMKKESGI